MGRRGLAVICGVCLLGALEACTFGTHTGNFAPARGPAGIGVRIDARPGADREVRYEGELLAVEEESLLVLASGIVTRLHYEAISSARFDQRGDLASHRYRSLRPSWRAPSETGAGVGAVPDAEMREQLRLVSRFPQGVSPELLQRLLGAYGQTELVVVAHSATP